MDEVATRYSTEVKAVAQRGERDHVKLGEAASTISGAKRSRPPSLGGEELFEQVETARG